MKGTDQCRFSFTEGPTNSWFAAEEHQSHRCRFDTTTYPSLYRAGSLHFVLRLLLWQHTNGSCLELRLHISVLRLREACQTTRETCMKR